MYNMINRQMIFEILKITWLLKKWIARSMYIYPMCVNVYLHMYKHVYVNDEGIIHLGVYRLEWAIITSRNTCKLLGPKYAQCVCKTFSLNRTRIFTPNINTQSVRRKLKTPRRTAYIK